MHSKLTVYPLLLALALFLASVPVTAANWGGEIGLQTSVLYSGGFRTELQVHGVLEPFLPDQPPFSTRIAVEGGIAPSRAELDMRYLYLRWQKGSQQITVGRQPVGWGYGSMLNPLGYGLDVTGLGGQSVTPVVDGLRYTGSFGGGRRLDLVMDYAGSRGEWSLHDLGYGARFRAPVAGWDFSANGSSPPLSLPLGPEPDALALQERLLRAGVSLKGDAGPVGVYGSLGLVRLHEANEQDILLQVGMDASTTLGSSYQRRPLTVQMEYLRFLGDTLNPGLLLAFGDDSGTQDMTTAPPSEDASGPMTGLFLINTTLQWDYFTHLGTALIWPVGTGTVVLAPYLVSDLGGNLELQVQGDMMRMTDGTYDFGVRLGLKRFF